MKDNRLTVHNWTRFMLLTLSFHASKACVAMEQTPDSKSSSFTFRFRVLDLQMLWSSENLAAALASLTSIG